MTGFARLSGSRDNLQWTWEVKSVNGRGLDVRFKLPQEFSALELDLKKVTNKVFKRGNLQVNLSLQTTSDTGKFEVNPQLYAALSEFVTREGGTIDPSQILSVPGLIQQAKSDWDEETRQAYYQDVFASYEALLKALKRAREAEGAALLPIITTLVNEIEDGVLKSEEAARGLSMRIKTRLEAKLQALLDNQVDPERLAQEVAILATKADITEELDRLKAHCVQTQALLLKGSPVGRDLDFLAQEFNREINTLCSKSSEIELTRVGLDMKKSVEQFREQSANVE